MNPYVLVAGLIMWALSGIGAFTYGTTVGRDAQIAKTVEIKQAIEDTREIARQGAASEIAKIKVRNTTIQGKVETVIRDNPVYRDCRHSPDALRLLNDALTGNETGPGRDGGGSLPGTQSAVR